MARLIDADALKQKFVAWLPKADDEFMSGDIHPIENIAVSAIMEIEEAPTIDPVKQFANELINRLNNNASRYVGGICNGRFYPETELFDVDEVYEIIDRVLDGVPEDEGARMDGGAEDGKSD